MKKALLLTACWLALAAHAVEPWQITETRYCGPPRRDANGDIIRSSTVRTMFQRIHPCPSTLSRTGACPGWAKDHSMPLACGGCDSVSNMTWLDQETKRLKDATERRINVNPFGLDACQQKPTGSVMLVPER